MSEQNMHYTYIIARLSQRLYYRILCVGKALIVALVECDD